MPAQFQSIRVPDLGAGIDAEAAENRIQVGFMEDIENADPKPAGQIETRKGYQGYGGNLPVRVVSVIQTASPNQICFTLDANIDLSAIRAQPIIVRGKVSNTTSGDFPSNSYVTRYYSDFHLDIKETFATGTHTDTIPQATHAISNSIIWGGATESLSVVNSSNRQFFLDSFSVNQGTKDVSYGYTNGTGTAFDGYVFLKGRTNTTGTVYNSGSTAISTGTATYTILASTHNLNNNNILAKVFLDTGATYDEIFPDTILINESTGDVSISITNGTGSPYNAVFSLVSADTANFKTGNIGSAGTVSVDIDITNQSPFMFVGCYLKGASNLEIVIPDSIQVDTTTNTATVTFTNASNIGRVFYVTWEFASISTNVLCVTPYTSANVTDTAPQLTLWGLDHSEIYGANRLNNAGWTSHIDSYKSIGENRLVSGLGGNLFTAQNIDEGTNSTDYLMPTLYPRINGNLNQEVSIGPAFFDTSDSPLRTRGYITGTTGATNYFTITNIAYDSGNGWVNYTINVPSMVISGTLSTIISTGILADQLTTAQCGWSYHNGTFTIRQVTSGVDTLNIWVDNSQVTSSDFDETNVGGLGGIFTDQITFQGSRAAPFLPEDKLLSGLFNPDTTDLRVVNSALVTGVPTILVKNCIESTDMPSLLNITAERTGRVLPLRDLFNSATVENVVRGDMLSYSEIDRLLRVLYINVEDSLDITSFDGNTSTDVTVTLASGSTDFLAIGSRILIFGTTYFNGEFEVSDITSATTFTISSTESNTDSGGYIIGKTVEIDESFEFQDTETSTVVIDVPTRWIPIEFPTDTYNLTPKTRERYFDSNAYIEQPILRSTIVQDNMYLTNGDDEVLKFDGTDIYRAGLFRWQPNLFVSQDTVSAGKITLDNPSILTTAVASNNRFTVAPENQQIFSIGDYIKNSADGFIYIIKDIGVDSSTTPTKAYIYVDRVIAGTTSASSLTRISNYKYYFRLNAVDANSTLIASAITGSDDFVIRMAENAAVHIRLVGMPAWDIYDYDRLEVQIYRTKSNTVAPFYLLSTIQMNFDSTGGYIDYADTDSDDNLIQLDAISTALKGQELGTAWSEPLRAKYITSADNRLILANVRDYPELNIQIVNNGAPPVASKFTATANALWTFRKDNTDAGTTTDMVNRVLYQFVDTTAAKLVSAVANSATTFSITTTLAHGLSVGSWVYLYHGTDKTGANFNDLTYAGWWQVAVVNSAVQFTVNYTHSHTVTLANEINRVLISTVTTNIPVSISTTTAFDFNYGMLNGNDNGTNTQPYKFIAMKRMAEAINSSMRKVDTTVTGMSSFVPWMIASAGNEFTAGQLIVRQPKATSTFLEVQFPNLDNDFFVYVNDTRRFSNASASAIVKEFPSRLLISYPNFPEIFDNPTAAVDADSASAIDVNSADGQDITAVIPFFGQSAFGAALNSGVVVVFKTNSIYLVDVSLKARGQPAVQKLDTRGKGCTAPYSVSLTKSGIMFANETGIYRLNHNLQIDYVGRKYERKWKEGLNKNYIEFVTGTHDTDANTYKLSYPSGTDTENSLVAVYNHTREDMTQGGYGSWTSYTNHAAIGWANLVANSYFASTTGRVFSVRNLGDATDYRDDSSAIAMTILVASTDFGDSGKRKIVKNVITHYRALYDVVGATLQTSVDLLDNFQDTDAFEIRAVTSGGGLSNTANQKIVTIQSSLGRKKCVYVQLKYANETLDEPVSITGIDYLVSPLTERGILQAAVTKE